MIITRMKKIVQVLYIDKKIRSDRKINTGNIPCFCTFRRDRIEGKFILNEIV